MIAPLVLFAGLAIPLTPKAYVTDVPGVLSYATVQRLSSELRTYEQRTGYHVIVWIGETTGDTPLEEWTVRAANQWRIGRRSFDDGAILFLFMRDRKVRIEVGYGLESALTDASSSEIIRQTIVPRLRAGDTDGAVQAGAQRMLTTITPGYSFGANDVAQTETARPDSSVVSAVVLLLLLVFVVGFAGVVIAALVLSKRGQGGGSTDYSSGAASSDGSSSESADSGSTGGAFGGGGASGGW